MPRRLTTRPTLSPVFAGTGAGLCSWAEATRAPTLGSRYGDQLYLYAYFVPPLQRCQEPCTAHHVLNLLVPTTACVQAGIVTVKSTPEGDGRIVNINGPGLPLLLFACLCVFVRATSAP